MGMLRAAANAIFADCYTDGYTSARMFKCSIFLPQHYDMI